MGNELLISALEYAARGWAVIPLHSAKSGNCSCGKPQCSSAAKHPRIKKWQESGTTEPKNIRRWWRKWPDANIGILTGAKSGLVVLDVDDGCDRPGSEELARIRKQHGVEPTYSITTGKGSHLYFRHPGTTVVGKVKLFGAGLDVRADGNYVVAAPSMHANGTRYAIVNGDVPLATMPLWLMQETIKGTEQEISKGSNMRQANSEVRGEILEGERDNRLFRIGSAMRGQSAMSQTEIEAALLTHNAKHCVPPLSEEQIYKIAAQVCKYPPELGKNRRSARAEDNPLHWFPFSVREWLVSENIFLMTDYETGWYINLMVRAWQRGGVLDADLTRLAKLAKASSVADFESNCERVFADFEPAKINDRDVLINRKMAEQYSETLEKWMQKREAGEASAQKRNGTTPTYCREEQMQTIQ